MRELGLFAGAGGGLLASHLLGWDTVCAVEINPYCQRVLAQRQRDGMLPVFPIWDDIRTFDGKPWRGTGLAGDRSGLWFEMLRVIGEVRPAYVFAENSPMLRTRGLDVVLEGLAGLGYACAWGVLGAHHVGAPIKRDHLWICAKMAQSYAINGAEARLGLSQESCPDEQTSLRRGAERGLGGGGGTPWVVSADVESGVADGLADIVDRLCAVGNGQVPAVAALAWEVISGVLE